MARNLLVVDDSPTIRQMLFKAFGEAGWQVRTAADVREARAAQMRGRGDVILTDLNMPGESGCDLIRWVHKNYPKTRILLMSSEGRTCAECPFSPSCSIIQKPLDLPRLVELVSRLSEARGK